MDRLRSPGGCPWDAAQTHALAGALPARGGYEVLEAIETGDPALLREELGDLLLQVLFHARIAQELPAEQAFGIDEVAGDLVDKLVRRHPHVFATAPAPARRSRADQLNETWERQKIAEKGRTLGRRRRAARPAGAGAGGQAGRPRRARLGWRRIDRLGHRRSAVARR